MENTVAIDVGASAAAEPTIHMQQMPLTFLKDGDTAHVAKVRGDSDIQHHLGNLGFVEGAQVRVISEQSGNLIVEIKGTQVALGKSVASKIITC